MGEKMKNVEVKLEDEGFEEVEGGKSQEPDTGNQGAGNQGAPSGQAEPTPGANRPDFRVVQADKDKDGKPLYVNVGGMWKNISRNGKEFYVLRIGQLKLLVFQNDRK
jgi:hypothetical protein